MSATKPREQHRKRKANKKQNRNKYVNILVRHQTASSCASAFRLCNTSMSEPMAPNAITCYSRSKDEELQWVLMQQMKSSYFHRRIVRS